MKCLIRLVLMTSSLLIASISIAAQDDLSQTNLNKLKRAALRRNTGGGPRGPKTPKFGWGKRSSTGEVSYVDTEKRFLSSDPESWNVKELRQSKWSDNNPRKCEWYGCRVERSGWESNYGKRNALAMRRRYEDVSDDDDVTDQKRQANRSGWNSAYGRRRRAAGRRTGN